MKKNFQYFLILGYVTFSPIITYGMEHKKIMSYESISVEEKVALALIPKEYHFENLTNEFVHDGSSIVFCPDKNPRYHVSVVGHKPLYTDDLALHQPTARFAVQNGGTNENVLLIGNLQTRNLSSSKTNLKESLSMLKFSPDGTRLAALTQGHTFIIFGLLGDTIYSVGMLSDMGIIAYAFKPNSSQELVMGRNNNKIMYGKISYAGDSSEFTEIPLKSPLIDLSYTSDGRKIVIIHKDELTISQDEPFSGISGSLLDKTIQNTAKVFYTYDADICVLLEKENGKNILTKIQAKP